MFSLSGRRGLKWRLLPAIELLFRAVGRRWVDFYAWMLNRQEKNNSIDKIIKANKSAADKHKGLYDLSTTDTHLRFLLAQGLEPQHVFVDFGCGYGRTAIPLLHYLEPGLYTGIEISSERLRMARDYVDREGLQGKRPRFVESKDLDISYLPDASVDAVWALTVASHMPLVDLTRLMHAMWRILRPGGWFVFDFIASEAGERRSSVKDFEYPAVAVRQAAEAEGFRVSVVDFQAGGEQPPEWGYPNCVVFRIEKA